MKYSTKKPLRKVYLCKDETMKNGDILLQFDKPFNYCLPQVILKRSLDKFELTFKKQLFYRNWAALELVNEFKLHQISGTKGRYVGHIDCPPHVGYPDYYSDFIPY